MISSAITLQRAALIALLGAAATLGGAWAFESAGYQPCALCLEQRVPYYFGVPLAFAAYALAGGGYRRQAGLALVAFGILFLYGAGFAAYHAGIEWGWWAGPADCAPTRGLQTDASKLLSGLGQDTPPSCTEAALRIFGLSLAGYNVLISLALSAVALTAGAKARWFASDSENAA